MLVFRDAWTDEPTAGAFARLGTLLDALGTARGEAAVGLATEVLIEAGALEVALVDRLGPERDEIGPEVEALRRAGEACGRLFRAALKGACERDTQAARQAWALAGTGSLPAEVRLKAAEGFAWYALHPEFYLGAAERAVATMGGERAAVVGLRGIGAPLSSAVSAELEARGVIVETFTVRPRGHPWDRSLALGPALERTLRALAAEGRTFLVVDEGPGLSGSSLTGAALALEALGVRAARIALLPAHDVDPSGFASERARAAWPRFARFPAYGARPDPAPALEGAVDLSGGLWRQVLFGGRPVPVAPAFERRKHLDPDGRLWKFAGLGRRGREAFRLTEALADAGLGPRPVAYRTGYVASARLDGRPLRRRSADAGAVGRALDHLAFVARSRRTGRIADSAPLVAALRRNAELAGLGPLSPAVERVLAALPSGPEVRVDGRLQPHEWLATSAGLLKTDAADHGDDHFLPGPTDPAWDVAGLIEEWSLGDRAAEVIERAARAQGDPTLAARTPAYRAFYAAVRLGFATTAAPGAGGRDRAGLERAARVWRGRLHEALARLEG